MDRGNDATRCEVEGLIELLCQEMHDAWVQTKRRQGYVQGADVDEYRKTHPDIVPFEALDDQHLVLERQVAGALLRSLFELGFRCSRRDSPYAPDEPLGDILVGQPIVDALAAVSHEAWMNMRVKQGFILGDKTDYRARRHRDLLPFAQVSAEKRELDLSVAKALLQGVYKHGYMLARRPTRNAGLRRGQAM